jgi:probable rRNA maturation factor
VHLDVTIQLETPEWKPALRPYCKTVRDMCNSVLSDTRLAKRDCIFTMAVVLADDALIRQLNHTYRGKNKATNVLSFPSMPDIERQVIRLTKGQEAFELGDIILAYSTVQKEAIKQGKPFRHHAMHLITHGMLHLLGYDHEQESDAVIMERKEIKILRKQYIKNPYL